MDGNLTSSGVSLTTSGNLYLDVDLSQRIKIDGIRLYASDLTKSSNISFYYKNTVTGTYTLLSTSVSSYYYTTIPDPSAPRFVRATVSGVNINLYEFQIFNDDQIVAFGTDGSAYAEYISDTPVGEVGTPEAIAIYNDGTSNIPADAYVAIDYTGVDADNYLEISTSQNGTYYALSDGVLQESDAEDETYRWSMGTFATTQVVGDKVIVGSAVVGGTRLGELPLVTNTTSFNTGHNTWDWDRVNKKMYAMGRDSGTLKLWEYLYSTDTWNYIGEIDPSGSSEDNFAIMCYCAVSGTNRIYAMTELTGTFGYYDIDGVENNWTSAANPSWSYITESRDKVSICSDGTRFIYALSSDYGNETNKEFKRFDTVSGTWTDMSNGYLQPAYTAGGASTLCNNTCLTYDYDRSWIYLVEASEQNSESRSYIQRYVISTDTWSTTYLNVQSIFSTTHVIQSVSYHSNWVYVSCNPFFTSGYFFRYNVSTSEVQTINLGYEHYDPDDDGPGVYVLAIDPPAESDFESAVYFAQIEGQRNYLVSYNAASTSVGTYTTPIFKLPNKYNASYFIINGDTTSGTGSLSYDSSMYNGTIRVKSSDTAPIIMNEIFLLCNDNTTSTTVHQYEVYTGDTTYDWYNATDSVGDYVAAVDRRTGYVAITHGETTGRVAITNQNGTEQYTASNSSYADPEFLEFDKSGGLWHMGDAVSNATLRHFDYQLNVTASLPSLTGLYDMSAEMDGDGVWYIDSTDGLVVHLDEDCASLGTIVLDDPRAICGKLDNGCWVIDNGDQKAYEYSSAGVLLGTVTLGRDGDHMSSDLNDGFYYISGSYVYHVTSAGVEDMDIYIGSNLDRVYGGHEGCIVSNSTNRWVKYIDKSTGTVTRTWDVSARTTAIRYPALRSIKYDDYRDFKFTTGAFPASYDPVWGTNGTADWLEVRKDGYFLPKDTYHQVEITVRNAAILEQVVLAPAIKIQDIPRQSYKYMYIRSDVPEGVDVDQYESRLKAWWGVAE
jgi:hypothetical protein